MEPPHAWGVLPFGNAPVIVELGDVLVSSAQICPVGPSDEGLQRSAVLLGIHEGASPWRTSAGHRSHVLDALGRPLTLLVVVRGQQSHSALEATQSFGRGAIRVNALPSADMSEADDVREHLRKAGKVLRASRDKEARALMEVEGLVGRATKAGLSVTEISTLGCISRPTVYRVLGVRPETDPPGHERAVLYGYGW